MVSFRNILHRPFQEGDGDGKGTAAPCTAVTFTVCYSDKGELEVVIPTLAGKYSDISSKENILEYVLPCKINERICCLNRRMIYSVNEIRYPQQLLQSYYNQ